jgi:hypothetical protein
MEEQQAAHAKPAGQSGAPEQQGRRDGVITLVLTADNHLGSLAFSQHPRKREERLQRLRRAFRQATDFAIAQGVDLFVQAGDLFDSTTPDEHERSFVAERLAQLKQAGIQALAIGGTHDTPAETSSPHSTPAPQVSYARLGALHYLSSPSAGATRPVEPTFIEIRGIRVGACGLNVVAGQAGDPLEHFLVSDDIERANISLLLLHAPIEGLTTGSSLLDTRAVVAKSSIARQAAFTCILAGYHHGYSRHSIGMTELIVAGATQHIDFSSPGHAPGFVFLGLAPDGVRWCNHIAVDAMPLQSLVIHTNELWPTASTEHEHTSGPGRNTVVPTTVATSTEDEDVAETVGNSAAKASSQQPTDIILERLRPLCSSDAMIQLKLEGELTRRHYHQLDLNRIRRYGEEHCFALAIDDTPLLLLPEQEAALTEAGERFSPREELVTLVEEWIVATNDENEKKALRTTREELLLALDEGKRSR